MNSQCSKYLMFFKTNARLQYPNEIIGDLIYLQIMELVVGVNPFFNSNYKIGRNYILTYIYI